MNLILLAAACTQLWNMAELGETPAVRSVPHLSRDGVEAVMIDGPAWKGRPTSAFAYLAIPDGASVSNKVPGIVLVHGGLGTSYARWAKLWKSRGYAAIAVDNCGGWPVHGEGNDWLRHRKSGPSGWGGFDTLDEPLGDQWFYHAVAVSVLSHSYLRSLPQVDVRAIGVTGISWGGVLTCVLAAVDHRFAYAVPVYGCGFLGEGDAHAGRVLTKDLAKRTRWLSMWDPSLFLPQAKCPFLWVDGTNDFAFPLDSVRKSADLVKDSAFTTVVRMEHAHVPGENPPEILAFADHYARGRKDIVRIVAAKTENGVLTVDFNAHGRRVVRAEFVWTAGTEADWQKRRYERKDVPDFRPESRTVSAPVPADAQVWSLSLVTDDGLRFSSSPEFMNRNSAQRDGRP